MGHVELGLLFLQLAQVVILFNNLLYKEWVSNDDKDCSIIPIKLKGYRKKNKVIEINFCFNNKEDYFIIINFHVHLQAACVLGQKSLKDFWQEGGDLGVCAINRDICCCFTTVRKKSLTVTALVQTNIT